MGRAEMGIFPYDCDDCGKYMFTGNPPTVPDHENVDFWYFPPGAKGRGDGPRRLMLCYACFTKRQGCSVCERSAVQIRSDVLREEKETERALLGSISEPLSAEAQRRVELRCKLRVLRWCGNVETSEMSSSGIRFPTMDLLRARSTQCLGRRYVCSDCYVGTIREVGATILGSVFYPSGKSIAELAEGGVATTFRTQRPRVRVRVRGPAAAAAVADDSDDLDALSDDTFGLVLSFLEFPKEILGQICLVCRKWARFIFTNPFFRSFAQHNLVVRPDSVSPSCVGTQRTSNRLPTSGSTLNLGSNDHLVIRAIRFLKKFHGYSLKCVQTCDFGSGGVSNEMFVMLLVHAFGEASVRSCVPFDAMYECHKCGKEYERVTYSEDEDEDVYEKWVCDFCEVPGQTRRLHCRACKSDVCPNCTGRLKIAKNYQCPTCRGLLKMGSRPKAFGYENGYRCDLCKADRKFPGLICDHCLVDICPDCKHQIAIAGKTERLPYLGWSGSLLQVGPAFDPRGEIPDGLVTRLCLDHIAGAGHIGDVQRAWILFDDLPLLRARCAASITDLAVTLVLPVDSPSIVLDLTMFESLRKLTLQDFSVDTQILPVPKLETIHLFECNGVDGSDIARMPRLANIVADLDSAKNFPVDVIKGDLLRRLCISNLSLEGPVEAGHFLSRPTAANLVEITLEALDYKRMVYAFQNLEKLRSVDFLLVADDAFAAKEYLRAAKPKLFRSNVVKARISLQANFFPRVLLAFLKRFTPNVEDLELGWYGGEDDEFEALRGFPALRSYSSECHVSKPLPSLLSVAQHPRIVKVKISGQTLASCVPVLLSSKSLEVLIVNCAFPSVKSLAKKYPQSRLHSIKASSVRREDLPKLAKILPSLRRVAYDGVAKRGETWPDFDQWGWFERPPPPARRRKKTFWQKLKFW